MARSPLKVKDRQPGALTRQERLEMIAMNEQIPHYLSALSTLPPPSPPLPPQDPAEAILQEGFALQRRALERHFTLAEPRSQAEWASSFEALNHRYGLGMRRGDIAILSAFYAGWDLPEVENYRQELEGQLRAADMLAETERLQAVGLQSTRRLGDVPHAPREREENTATHSLVAALELADGLGFKHYDSDLNVSDAALQEFARQGMLAVLWHDAGEAFQEISTEFSRSGPATLAIDREELEQEITTRLYSIYRTVLMRDYGYSERDFSHNQHEVEQFFLVGNGRHSHAHLLNPVTKIADKLAGDEEPLKGFLTRDDMAQRQAGGDPALLQKISVTGIEVELYPYEVAKDRYSELCVNLSLRPVEKAETVLQQAISDRKPLHDIPRQDDGELPADAVVIRTIPHLLEAIETREKLSTLRRKREGKEELPEGKSAFLARFRQRAEGKALGYLARGPLYYQADANREGAVSSPAEDASLAEREAYQQQLGRVWQGQNSKPIAWVRSAAEISPPSPNGSAPVTVAVSDPEVTLTEGAATFQNPEGTTLHYRAYRLPEKKEIRIEGAPVQSAVQRMQQVRGRG
jgi:hypothetical protein